MTRTIRIPNSATRRGGIAFVKLLNWVNEPATTGFDFDGRLLRPGQQIDEAELWPSEDWPGVPVLLECAGITEPGWGHRRSSYCYIVWQYDREAGEWREVARTTAVDSEWCYVLGPIARRLVVGEVLPRPRREIIDLADQLIIAINEVVLSHLTESDAAAVLARLHDILASLASRQNRRFDNRPGNGIRLSSMARRNPDLRKATREELSKAAAILGSVGGRKRYENISREYLAEIGRKGALKRWGDRKKTEGAAA